MKMKYIITLIVFTYLIVLLSMYYSLAIINDNIKKTENPVILSESESNLNCSKDNLINISLCLGYQLETWYNYNISNTGKELTMEELKLNGGVCSHFAEWYKQELIKLGGTYLNDEDKLLIQQNDSNFYITKGKFPVTKDISHVVTIVSDNHYYCVLDQLNIKCTEFAQ